MDLYFVEHIDLSGATLEDDQFRHACKVMRLGVGDQILLTDGKGGRAIGRFTAISKRSAGLEILEHDILPEPQYAVDIAVAITKNTKRIEWAAEKMTEMGVRSITPLICQHSERARINTGRLDKILVSALKQSRQFYLPKLENPVAFDEFCKSRVKEFNGRRYIAYLSDQSTSLRHNYNAGNDVLFLVGPEGDFSHEEIELAMSLDCIPVTLGKTRLRTETAAVAAVAYIHALND